MSHPQGDDQRDQSHADKVEDVGARRRHRYDIYRAGVLIESAAIFTTSAG